MSICGCALVTWAADHQEEVTVTVDDVQSISADANVDLLLDRYPSIVPVFLERRMHCVGCAMARFETLADVCRIYQKPIEPLLAEMRAVVARDARPPNQDGL